MFRPIMQLTFSLPGSFTLTVAVRKKWLPKRQLENARGDAETKAWLLG
jgi:hypothetical protein